MLEKLHSTIKWKGLQVEQAFDPTVGQPLTQPRVQDLFAALPEQMRPRTLWIWATWIRHHMSIPRLYMMKIKELSYKLHLEEILASFFVQLTSFF